MKDEPDAKIYDLEAEIAHLGEGGGDAQARRRVLMALAHVEVFLATTETLELERPELPSGVQFLYVSDGPDQSQPMLAVFSSEEIARQSDLPGAEFAYRSRVPGPFAVLTASEGSGIMINPNHAHNFRIGPEVVDFMRQHTQEALTNATRIAEQQENDWN